MQLHSIPFYRSHDRILFLICLGTGKFNLLKPNGVSLGLDLLLQNDVFICSVFHSVWIIWLHVQRNFRYVITHMVYICGSVLLSNDTNSACECCTILHNVKHFFPIFGLNTLCFECTRWTSAKGSKVQALIIEEC